MTEEQTRKSAQQEREGYRLQILRPGFEPQGNRWYKDNTREPIRDETLRDGFVSLGAVGQVSDVPTTSSKPRYFLKADFAKLFDPNLQGKELDQAIAGWRDKALTRSALARIALVRSGAAGSDAGCTGDVS